MLISTKGRYALRVMVDLAEHSSGGFLAMKEIAERQEISLKYLERILPLLVKSNLIEGVHGKGGGYRLTDKPENYSVGKILRITEGDLAPVACLSCGSKPCEKSQECKTLPLWKKLKENVNGFLDGVTLYDLMKGVKF